MKIHVLVPSYDFDHVLGRALDSLEAQTRPPDKVMVIDDASEDTDFALRMWMRCEQVGYGFHRNTSRLWAVENIYQGIGRLAPDPEDVVFLLDGDDFLPPHALSRIAEVYRDPEVWLTYGNYLPWPHDTGQTLAKAYPSEVIRTRTFRSHPPYFNHPLTFRHKLWCEVGIDALKDDSGEFFKGGYDFAIMIPMLEMAAPDHFRFLNETLYHYNAVNPISDSLVNPLSCIETSRIVASRPKREQLRWPAPMSDVGVIDHQNRRPYGRTATYEMGAGWLRDCDLVEDWGCGRGWFIRFRSGDCRAVDVGVDSVPGDNPFADVLADLRTYRSEVPGIFMRHVLEHNYDWQLILENAMASFTERMFLVIFTPWSETGQTEVLMVNHDPIYGDAPNPTLSFDFEELMGVIGDVKVEYERLETETLYGVEHVFRLSR